MNNLTNEKRRALGAKNGSEVVFEIECGSASITKVLSEDLSRAFFAQPGLKVEDLTQIGEPVVKLTINTKRINSNHIIPVQLL